MVCTADDLLVWKDFPKGLRVLLLDEDVDSAAEIRSKLEEMDYAVSTFHSENEALSAISEGFHVAIVEVRAENEDGRFKFLKSAKDLPTIMISEVNLLSTMMKCIALGAVEFLEKPVSEEKLRNIWQHVAHKAFAGLKDQSEAMKSVHNLERLDIKEELTQNQEQINEESLPDTPSTPQLKQAVRLVDNGDCQDQDQDQTSTHHNDIDSLVSETTTEKKSSKSLDDSNPDLTKQNEASNSRGTKSSRRKMKVDWTCELHKKFVQAVEQLGVDQAIPSRILELMNVEGLTRHNVASHLQKYRLQRRHILPKESSRKWPQTRRNYYPQQKPIMAYPPYLSNHTFPPPAWPPPHAYAAPPHLYYPPCHPSETWLWNPFSRFQVQAEAWGCPQPSFPQNASHFQTRDSMHPNNSFDHSPGDEVIDKVVKEAINKPWLPLPLGLKPPSTESVISELSKQGISTVPPQINSCRRC